MLQIQPFIAQFVECFMKCIRGSKIAINHAIIPVIQAILVLNVPINVGILGTIRHITGLLASILCEP